jgi:protease-4
MIASLFIALGNIGIWLRNNWLRLFRRHIDYVRMELSGSLPEFSASMPRWQRLLRQQSGPLSLDVLRRRLKQIADDPYVQGIVLTVRDFAPGWASAQSLRRELQLFQERGKRVIVYLPGADLRSYFTLSGATTLIAPPTANLLLVGLRVDVQFLAEALAKFGVEAEVTAVSPYKSGGDTFTRTTISPESRSQLERILDQRYSMIVETIAAGRNLAPDTVRAAIDTALLTATAAREIGLLDATLYEDEIEQFLQDGNGETAAKHKLRFSEWPRARRALQRRYRRRYKRYIAVVSVEGANTSGQSRRSPLPLPIVGGAQAGSDSINQAIRQVERNARAAALVLHIDSPGGDSFASDLIWREVLRLRAKKPVVVSMGNVAASGGYYIAACANAIVAEAATLTGSIGVYSLRPNAERLFEQLGVHTVTLSRGAQSGIFALNERPDDAERALIRRNVFEAYDVFKQRVREGRTISAEQLEPIAGGRVWTGAEAFELGLIDLLGGLPQAVAKAQELAGLPIDAQAPLLRVAIGSGSLAPLPFPPTQPEALSTIMSEALRPRLLAALDWVILDT